MNDRAQPDTSAPKPSEPAQEIIVPSKPRDETTPGLLSRLLDLEQERISSSDKRTEVMRLAIEANITSDNRQFEFHMERLRVSDARSQRRDDLARGVIYIGVASSIAVAVFLLWAAFYGNARQSEIALQILQYVFAAVGGFGVFNALRRAGKRLLESNTSEEA